MKRTTVRKLGLFIPSRQRITISVNTDRIDAYAEVIFTFHGSRTPTTAASPRCAHPAHVPTAGLSGFCPCPAPAQVASTVLGSGNGIRFMHQHIYQ